jgi:hypothetical protein
MDGCKKFLKSTISSSKKKSLLYFSSLPVVVQPQYRGSTPLKPNFYYKYVTNCLLFQQLHLLPICYWHEYLDLILFFKITHGLLKTSASPVIQSSRRTTRSNSSNTVKYVIPRCKTTSYQKSFLVRTSRIWNTLIDAIDLHTDSLAVFKSCLLNYYLTLLILL